MPELRRIGEQENKNNSKPAVKIQSSELQTDARNLDLTTSLPVPLEKEREEEEKNEKRGLLGAGRELNKHAHTRS